MRRVVSEDGARRNLKRLDQIGARRWQGNHLRGTWERLLHEPWILDIGTTVKTVFGQQEGAEVGYKSPLLLTVTMFANKSVRQMLQRFPIFRALASVMIGLALFLTAGGHLAILQGVAWTKMVHNFSRTDSIGKAIEKTLDGQHPCRLCKKITETGSGKKDDGLTSSKIKLGEFVDQSSHQLPTPAEKSIHYPKSVLNKPAEISFAPPVPVPIFVG